MWKTIRPVAPLLLSYGLLLMANGLFGTLLGLRAKLEGFSTETVGFIMAGFFVGLLLGAMYAIRMVTYVGYIRSFAAFASIMSVAVLAHLLYINPLAWFILRVVAGFCLAGMVMVTESWLNGRASNATRGQILSLYMMINYLGSGAGQFLLTVANPEEFELFVIASMVFSIALVPILLTQTTAPKPASPRRMKFIELFRISPLGVLGTVCAGLVNSSINSMGPVFAHENGLSVHSISTFMACIILGGMLLQFPVGKLSDRFDRRSILFFTTVSIILACVLIIWATDQSRIWLFSAGAILGGFCYLVYPISSAQVNDLADKDRLVQVAASLLFAFGIGSSIGPIVASQIMGAFGSLGLFYYIGSIASGLALFATFRMFRRQPGKKKTTFLPLGIIGSSSKQLYIAAQKAARKYRKKA